jgi:dTDP-4-amino-4,6-dideoxygalactose transaminase
MKIPFLSFHSTNGVIRGEMLEAFSSVFDSNWYILGQRVTAFEEEYAAFNRVGHCVGVSNGLDALHLCLRVLGIGAGDEVIVPSNTYIATVLAVSYVNAAPVFVEPDIHSYNIDPARIEAAITRKTKAIMPVHLYGQACEMEAIMDIAERHKLFVVEDNAQAHSSSFKGKLTGGWGHINGTSFYPGKNLGALGDAGAVTTNDGVFAEKAAVLRNYGSQTKYYNEVVGYNMRLDEVQAAVLSVKLRYLQEWTRARCQIARWYDEGLVGTGDILLPEVIQGATHVYHIYMIRTRFRDQLQEYMREKGIGTMIHYPVPVHLQQAYASLGYVRGDFPLAEEIADTCLSLPLWPGMSLEQVEQVISVIHEFFKA